MHRGARSTARRLRTTPPHFGGQRSTSTTLMGVSISGDGRRRRELELTSIALPTLQARGEGDAAAFDGRRRRESRAKQQQHISTEERALDELHLSDDVDGLATEFDEEEWAAVAAAVEAELDDALRLGVEMEVDHISRVESTSMLGGSANASTSSSESYDNVATYDQRTFSIPHPHSSPGVGEEGDDDDDDDGSTPSASDWSGHGGFSSGRAGRIAAAKRGSCRGVCARHWPMMVAVGAINAVCWGWLPSALPFAAARAAAIDGGWGAPLLNSTTSSRLVFTFGSSAALLAPPGAAAADDAENARNAAEGRALAVAVWAGVVGLLVGSLCTFCVKGAGGAACRTSCGWCTSCLRAAEASSLAEGTSGGSDSHSQSQSQRRSRGRSNRGTILLTAATDVATIGSLEDISFEIDPGLPLSSASEEDDADAEIGRPGRGGAAASPTAATTPASPIRRGEGGSSTASRDCCSCTGERADDAAAHAWLFVILAVCLIVR